MGQLHKLVLKHWFVQKQDTIVGTQVDNIGVY